MMAKSLIELVSILLLETFIVLNCVEKSKGMIDADSTPKYGGNIYENNK